MSIRLGSINCVVVSSPDAAKLFFGTHDAIFTSRPKLELAKYLYYGNRGILLAEGEYWRNVRKLCKMELFAPVKINGFARMRKEEIEEMIEDVKVACLSHEVVNLGEFVGRLIEGMTCRMLFGKKNDESFVFKKLIDDVGAALGTFNLADYVPMLKPFDIQGLVPKFKSLSKNIDTMLETLINEREKGNASRIQRSDEMDFLDILFSVKDKYSVDDHKNLSNAIDKSSVKAILVDVISVSIDTSRSSIEWVLSNLVKHPRVMKKLQNEMKNIIGDKRIVEETDLEKLTYLHMVIKETFRLYPLVPLLMPRVSTQDVVINGYYIPKDTHVYVNVWAFGRDQEVWSENWAEFLPERFVDKEIDFRPNFQLMTFSTGRRGCPAMNLGLLNIGLVVSNLVHCFNWVFPNDMSPSELDMDDNFMLSMCKLNPLLAIPTDHILADGLVH